MTLSTIFGLLSGFVFAIAGAIYVRDVLAKKATPNIASFLIWGISNISQVAALIVKQVWHTIPFMAVNAIMCLLIFILSYQSKKFYFKLADKLSLIGALLGLLVWYITQDAAWNIYLLGIINTIAFVPLIIKSFKHPEMETTLPWRLNLLGSSLLVLAIPSAALIQWFVPARQIVCSVLVNIGLMRGIVKRKGHREYEPL